MTAHGDQLSALLARLEELESRLARERRVTDTIRELGNAVGRTGSLSDLLEPLLTNLAEVVEADRATLYILDEARGELVSRIILGEQVRAIRIKVGRGIAGTVASTGKPVRVASAYADPRFEPEWDLLTGYKTTSILAAPLKNHLGRTIGVIQVLNKKRGDHFTEEDESMMNVLAAQAAIVIDNSRLVMSLTQRNAQLVDAKQQLERRLKDLVLLLDLERATARANTIEQLAGAALDHVARACKARGAALQLAEEESGDLVQLVLDAASGELKRLGVKSGEGLLTHAMANQEELVLSQALEDARHSSRVEQQYPFHPGSALVVPLEGERGAIGAMAVFSKQGGQSFDEEDLTLLRLVSANVSTAVRLYRASEARERSERLTAIGRLLSQVIHDFKTPMTVISGYTQLMVDADDRALRAEYADEILKQFDLLTAMQREVLEFARGERSIFVRRVYLRKFFAEVTRQLMLELEGKPVELVMDVDTKVVARFDEGRVARAIHNLARNAVEAMAEHGGRLTIRGRLENNDLVLQVADTGPGIPQEIEGRLFQSFVTAGKQGGTGLGLAIVKKIVEEHNGSVEASSDANGACFTMRLPQPKPSEPVAPATKPMRMRRTPSRGTPIKSSP